MKVIIAEELPSLCPRADRPAPRIITVGLVQTRWHADASEHKTALSTGIAEAAHAGAAIVFLQELTMMRYLADERPNPSKRSDVAEDLTSGPSIEFFRQQARESGVFVCASIFEKTSDDNDRGYNTAVMVTPSGELVQRTRKMHIPVTSGYYEDEYFAHGPASAEAYPVVSPDAPGKPRLGLPTCWDEWFPEVARIYGLQGAELLAYPTAIGSEPDYPQFDTQPLWQQVITANGIANGLFMIVPNRYGCEGKITFYGSSFISDPFGRVLAQAPRDDDAVLVARLDLEQRQDWLTLFPFYATRRPDSYQALLTTGSTANRSTE
ncbi:nitrilase-related carbon-nitrogen hydrolase [Bifidobacterium aquikefiricola]|uniref:Nitrilase-related carbon-nitrogen hydrolase n=1 Tax=Bifidobacterium aquikefiricola TaxID=3059038 RepID=A0AB39U7K6_9BIFI